MRPPQPPLEAAAGSPVIGQRNSVEGMRSTSRDSCLEARGSRSADLSLVCASSRDSGDGEVSAPTDVEVPHVVCGENMNVKMRNFQTCDEETRPRRVERLPHGLARGCGQQR